MFLAQESPGSLTRWGTEEQEEVFPIAVKVNRADAGGAEAEGRIFGWFGPLALSQFSFYTHRKHEWHFSSPSVFIFKHLHK